MRADPRWSVDKELAMESCLRQWQENRGVWHGLRRAAVIAKRSEE